jgi:HEPN domain-containing protein
MGRRRHPPNDPREWLNRARSNLAGAGQLDPDRYLEDLCFDAQQAAEKAIKAVFIRRGLRFPYVHELRRLLQLLEQGGVKVPKIRLEGRRSDPIRCRRALSRRGASHHSKAVLQRRSHRGVRRPLGRAQDSVDRRGVKSQERVTALHRGAGRASGQDGPVKTEHVGFSSTRAFFV